MPTLFNIYMYSNINMCLLFCIMSDVKKICFQYTYLQVQMIV